MKTPRSSNVANDDTVYGYRFAPVLVGFVTLGFMLLWWNRFLGGQGIDGVFYYVGKQLLHGVIPYRDYALVSTPLEGIKAAALITVFGDRLAVLRFTGLVERVALSVVLFLWLRRYFPTVPAMIATLSGMCVFSAAAADTGFAYNHTASWYGVASGWAASLAMDSKRRYFGLFCGLVGNLRLSVFFDKANSGAGHYGDHSRNCWTLILASATGRNELWDSLSDIWPDG